MDTRSWATKFPPRLWNRLRPAGVQRRLLRLRLLQKIIPGCEYRFRAEPFCVPHPAGIRFQHFPESVFTISRNAYSHAPDSARKQCDRQEQDGDAGEGDAID